MTTFYCDEGEKGGGIGRGDGRSVEPMGLTAGNGKDGIAG